MLVTFPHKDEPEAKIDPPDSLSFAINTTNSKAAPFSNVCGTWQDDYTRLHRDTIEGRRKPRYFVMTWTFHMGTDIGGIGDRMSGLATGMLSALMTGRALLIKPALFRNDYIANMYTSPNINWNYDEVARKTGLKNMTDDVLEYVCPEGLTFRHMKQGVYKNMNLEQIYGDKEVSKNRHDSLLAFSTNRSMT